MVARAWGLHPDQLLTTDAGTYGLMLEVLAEEHRARQQNRR